MQWYNPMLPSIREMSPSNPFKAMIPAATQWIPPDVSWSVFAVNPWKLVPCNLSTSCSIMWVSARFWGVCEVKVALRVFADRLRSFGGGWRYRRAWRAVEGREAIGRVDQERVVVFSPFRFNPCCMPDLLFSFRCQCFRYLLPSSLESVEDKSFNFSDFDFDEDLNFLGSWRCDSFVLLLIRLARALSTISESSSLLSDISVSTWDEVPSVRCPDPFTLTTSSDSTFHCNSRRLMILQTKKTSYIGM